MSRSYKKNSDARYNAAAENRKKRALSLAKTIEAAERASERTAKAKRIAETVSGNWLKVLFSPISVRDKPPASSAPAAETQCPATQTRTTAIAGVSPAASSPVGPESFPSPAGPLSVDVAAQATSEANAVTPLEVMQGGRDCGTPASAAPKDPEAMETISKLVGSVQKAEAVAEEMAAPGIASTAPMQQTGSRSRRTQIRTETQRVLKDLGKAGPGAKGATVSSEHAAKDVSRPVPVTAAPPEAAEPVMPGLSAAESDQTRTVNHTAGTSAPTPQEIECAAQKELNRDGYYDYPEPIDFGQIYRGDTKAEFVRRALYYAGGGVGAVLLILFYILYLM